MQYNLAMMRIPSSIYRKIRLRLKLEKQDQPRSFSPIDRKNKLADYLSNRITPVSPIFIIESPTKQKKSTPKLTLINPPYLPSRKSEKYSKDLPVLRNNEKQ